MRRDSRPVSALARRPAVWLVSAGVSLPLVALLGYAADWSSTLEAVSGGNVWLLVAAAGLLCLEGIFSSLRLRMFAGSGPKSWCGAFAANAWYVVGIAYLPARLGEAVGVWAVHRYLGQNSGGAFSSILTQRLLDVFVLAGAVLPAAILASVWEQGSSLDGRLSGAAVAAAGIVLLLTGLLLIRPARAMTPVAAAAARFRHRAPDLRRACVRLALQARLWARHTYPKVARFPAIALTMAKWSANIAGLSAVLVASGIDLSPPMLAALAVMYNFLLVVPIPTLGGIGLGDAGIVALLTLASIPIADAAAAGLVLRAVLLLLPPFYAGATCLAIAVADTARLGNRT